MTISLKFNSVKKEGKLSVYLNDTCLLTYDQTTKQTVQSKLNVDGFVYDIAQLIASKTFKDYNIVLSKNIIINDVKKSLNIKKLNDSIQELYSKCINNCHSNVTYNIDISYIGYNNYNKKSGVEILKIGSPYCIEEQLLDKVNLIIKCINKKQDNRIYLLYYNNKKVYSMSIDGLMVNIKYKNCTHTENIKDIDIFNFNITSITIEKNILERVIGKYNY